ncbi:MAG: hypothetical protein KJO73_09080 [Croceitalea sp.]|nr:hypothetical protein [Croceitalea sp.]
MTPQEANKIIAEYMGLRFVELCDNESYAQPNDDNYERIVYSKSLDALVPVWRKLNEDHELNLTITSDTMDAFLFYFDHYSTQKTIYESPLNQSIQEAAAIATAKAIQELGNDNKR